MPGLYEIFYQAFSGQLQLLHRSLLDLEVLVGANLLDEAENTLLESGRRPHCGRGVLLVVRNGV